MTEPHPDVPLVRGADCPSDLTLDRLHQGEMTDARAQRELEHHVSDCAHCTTRMAFLAEGFAAFEEVDRDGVVGRLHQALADVDGGVAEPEGLGARIARWLSASWVPRLVVGAATIGIVVWIVGAPPEHPRPGAGTDVDVVRVKGSLGLKVYRERGGKVSETLSGDRFQADDRLRFEVDLPRDGHLMIVGVESSGALYLAYGEGAASRPEGAGGRHKLRGAVALDASVGEEWLHLVWCPRPFLLPELGAGRAAGTLDLPGGCDATAFLLVKGSR